MKLSRRGLIATIVYHALIVLLLVFAGLTFPDPPPGEEGILVNFGTDETGFGDYEPMGDDQQADEQEIPVNEETPEFVEEDPVPVQEVTETYTPPDPTPVDNTQDVEETRVKEDPKPTAEELERERQRIEQERIEREQREEEERIERERQAQAERLNNMGKNAFGNQGVGETEGSEGITEGASYGQLQEDYEKESGAVKPPEIITFPTQEEREASELDSLAREKEEPKTAIILPLKPL